MAVGGCVVAEQHGNIDERAKAEQPAVAVVDQLMRHGVGDLAKPEARAEEEAGLFPCAKLAVTGNGPDNGGKGCQMAEGEGDEQGICGREFGAFIGVTCDVRQGLIHQGGKGGHIEEDGKHPWAAEPQACGEQGQGGEAGRGKQGHGYSLHGGEIA
jgi:hypothetical protein